jgi:type IV fimbrial biogenesis protein FimT
MRSAQGETMPDRRSNNGFTLLELLVALAIVGIVVGIAVPSMARFVDNYRLETAARTVWSDVQSAKMAAIKENQSVTLTLNSSTTYSYSFTDGNGAVHSFSRDITQDCPGVDLSFSGGSTTIVFLGSGTRVEGAADTTITLSNASGQARAFPVSWTGRIGGIAQ